MRSGPKTKPKPDPIILATLPDPPKYLDPIARKHWREVCGAMNAAGNLAHADVDAIACYCTLFERWREAEQNVKEEGAVIVAPNGYSQKNPWLLIAWETIKDMRQYQIQFGLTPKSRGKVEVPKTASPEEERWTKLIG